MNTIFAPLVEAPASDETTLRETLVYVDANDAVSNVDYAFVAYKETHRRSGAWCVRIKGLDCGHAYFHPNAMRLQTRAATAEGKSSFAWSRILTPKPGDPRRIEFRVYVDDGRATAIEISLRLRKSDHSVDETVSATFPWPEA